MDNDVIGATIYSAGTYCPMLREFITFICTYCFGCINRIITVGDMLSSFSGKELRLIKKEPYAKCEWPDANRVFVMRGILLKAVVWAVITTTIGIPVATFAVTDQEDLSVGMRTLPLLTVKMEDSVTVAIIFDPALPASKEEAEGIKKILDGGFEIPGDLSLSSLLVPVGELNRLAGSKIAILTGGLNAHYDAISAAADNGGVLTMSTDLSCVRTNKCVLGIASKPHVEIYYSKLAAGAAKISFVQVFTMLVKEI